MTVRIAALAFAVVLLAGCTSSKQGQSSDVVSPPTVTHTATGTSPVDHPVATGPTTAATATSCPYATTDFVHNTLGLRLDRTTVLKSGGQVVGCRFYPLTHPNAQCDATCLHGEHLPGPNQPVVEIATQRYASATAAHNAFVLIARRGSNDQQVDLGGGVAGVCYQTDFYPKDHGTDYACATSKGVTVLIVRSVDTTGAFSTKALTQAVLGRIPA